MKETIFIVEDEMILNVQLKRFLEKNGYSVEIFPHGEPCLARLDSGTIPNLILMDINLGKNRMSGTKVTEKIYNRYDIPVVLHSAYTDKATLDTTKDMTKYGYIQKVPGNEQFILATIEMALKLFDSKKAHIESENKYKELLQHQQNIREEQNAFIAQEVHDELGQSLTSLHMGLSVIENDFSTAENLSQCAGIMEMVREMKETIDDTIQKTRELSWQLKPSVLDSCGIIEALEWQVYEYKRKLNLPVIFIKPEVDRVLDKNKSLALYRIVQEALTNCARYAEASEVRIEVVLNEEKIEIFIKDNGMGFVPENLDLRDSFGLVGMKERAKQFGGSVTVKSEKGIGTEVHMQLPINGAEK